MKIKITTFAIFLAGALMACQSNKPVAVPEAMFSDECSNKSTETSDVPRLLKSNTVDESKYIYTIYFNNHCSYDFLAISSTLWSFEEFNSAYWNVDPFIAYPQTGEFIASVDENNIESTRNIYLLSVLGAENTREVVFKGSSIVVNEPENLGFLK